jgi:hypothetical protein
MLHPRCFPMLVAAGALLAGCGVSRQAGLPVSSPVVLDAPAGRQHSHGIAWMAKGVKTRDLLYISNGNGTVSVYRYWQHTIAGVLTNFSQPLGECVDRSGNVFVADGKTDDIDEYAHGGSKTINIISESPYEPYGCAVSPTNGSIAVANFNDGYRTRGSIAVYPEGSNQPAIYDGLDEDHFIGCAYDDRGDLFVASRYYYDEYGLFDNDFYYLPKKSTSLIAIKLPGPSRDWIWKDVTSVAWDGKYWVVADGNTLYRFQINIKAQYIDSTALTASGYLGPVSLYRKTPKSPATEAVGGSTFASTASVDYWTYPAGGSPVGEITKDLDAPYGVAVSLGT